METKLSLFVLFIVFISLKAIGQELPIYSFCENEKGKSIKELETDYDKDTFLVVSNFREDTITFKFVNTTKDTLYLFKSYLNDYYYPSRYLHRVDRKQKIYKVTFIPIVKYVSTSLTDRVVLGENRIVANGQVLYDFLKLVPNSFCLIKIPYDKLFSKIESKNNVVRDFDVLEFKKIKTCTYKKDFGYKLVFEFAYYNNINLLCSKRNDDFIAYDKQAKSFKTISKTVKIKPFLK